MLWRSSSTEISTASGAVDLSGHAPAPGAPSAECGDSALRARRAPKAPRTPVALAPNPWSASELVPAEAATKE